MNRSKDPDAIGNLHILLRDTASRSVRIGSSRQITQDGTRRKSFSLDPDFDLLDKGPIRRTFFILILLFVLERKSN
jgi:hypothetical protein